MVLNEESYTLTKLSHAHRLTVGPRSVETVKNNSTCTRVTVMRTESSVYDDLFLRSREHQTLTAFKCMTASNRLILITSDSKGNVEGFSKGLR